MNETRLLNIHKDNKEAKQKQADIEKCLEDQLAQTFVLQVDTNLQLFQLNQSRSASSCRSQTPNPNNPIIQQWNWLEIINLFESYLLVESSLLESRFYPTNDALYLNVFTRVLSENQKLYRTIKKLYDFFLLTNEDSTSRDHERSFKRMSSMNSQRASISSTAFQAMPVTSTASTVSPVDLIACSGCYLIDFVLNKFNFTNLDEFTLSSRKFSDYENLLIKLMHHIKLYLITEYPLNSMSHSGQRLSTTSMHFNKPISRDSVISYYILFIGHLTSTERGCALIELFKLSNLIIQILEIYKDLNLMKLIVSTFNFYVSSKSRFILEKCLCMTVTTLDTAFYNKDFIDNLNDFKFYTLKLIFNLYRANNRKFETFFLDVIFKSVFKLIDDANSWEKVLLNRSMCLDQNKIENLVEFTLNLVEYFLNQRREFINGVLEFFYDDQIFIDMLEKLSVNSLIVKKSKILDTKLKLLVFKFKLSEVNLNKIGLLDEQGFIENQLKMWYETQKMHTAYFQLIERYLFDANSINLYHINELDDRVDFSL
jgi:hypothetical protein